jgi:hypothetical protein
MKLPIRIFTFIAALGVALSATAVRPALAQDTPSTDLVQAALDRTDMRIEQAESLVMGSDNEQAGLQLSAAVDLQARAKSAFGSAELALAYHLTIEARGHADQAIAIIKNLPDPDRVKAQLERTRELLERAKERIEECNNDRARALLRAAFDIQLRAEEAARNSHYLVALQLTVNAREKAQTALRLCNLAENLQEAAERAIMRTDNILTRVQEAIEGCNNEQARASLAHGFELQDKAKSEYSSEHFRAALNLTLAARRAAYRAARLCGDNK